MITKNDIQKIWLTQTAIHILLNDGRQAQELFNDYQRLKYATPTQREAYTLSPFGIHWEELDEDLSFDGFFKEKKPLSELGQFFKRFPELNASAFARRLNIPQPLFAAYLLGTKKPSPERLQKIKQSVQEFQKELLVVEL